MTNHRFGFWSWLVAAALLGATRLQADAIPAIVNEIPGDGHVEYQIVNQSNLTGTPFDITALVVSTGPDGTNPLVSQALADGGWLTQVVDAASWEQEMGGEGSGLATWHQYTGRTYQSIYPPEPTFPPTPTMGYYLNYSLVSGHIWPPEPTHGYPPQPSRPGTLLSGFLRLGSAASDFFVAGPTDASQEFTLGDVQTFAAPVTLAPAPSTIVMGLFAVAALGTVAIRKRRARRPV